MPTAEEAIAQAAEAARLRSNADAGARRWIAQARALEHGREWAIVPLAPEDVPGATFAIRKERSLAGAGRVVAMGDLIEQRRSVVAASAATAPELGADSHPGFLGDEVLTGIGASPGMDQIVLGDRWMIFAAIGTSADAALSPEGAAGVISDGEDSVGIGVYTANGITYVVGWIGATITPGIAIAHDAVFRVELLLADNRLTLRVRDGSSYEGETSSVEHDGTPAISATPVQIGDAHGAGFVGVIAYALAVEGVPDDRSLRAHRHWADALDVIVPSAPGVADGILTEAGDALLTEAGDRLLLE